MPRFAPADQVCRRGRQRGHRQVAVAGIAVVGVLGGAGLAVAAPLAGGRGEGPHGDDRTAASGAASGSPDRTVASGSPSTGSPPASTLVIPDRLMLRPEDVPSGYALPYGVGYSSTTPSPWPAGIPCDALAASAYPSREAELVWRTVTFGEGSTREVRQTVVRYRPGGAQASIADLDAALPSCDERASMQRFPVVARDVAGDQSRLIRVEQVDSGEAVRYVAVVRVGAYVSTVEAVGGLRGLDIAGVEMVLLDADIAGCVSVWLENDGLLDATGGR